MIKKLYVILLYLFAIFGLFSFGLSVVSSLHLSDCQTILGQNLSSLNGSQSAYAKFQSCKNAPDVMQVWMQIKSSGREILVFDSLYASTKKLYLEWDDTGSLTINYPSSISLKTQARTYEGIKVYYKPY